MKFGRNKSMDLTELGWRIQGTVRFIKHALILLALLWVFVALGGEAWFESACIKGGLSQTQAVAINRQEWGTCSDYHRKSGGCEAQIKDQVVVRECSEFLHAISLRNVKFW